MEAIKLNSEASEPRNAGFRAAPPPLPELLR